MLPSAQITLDCGCFADNCVVAPRFKFVACHSGLVAHNLLIFIARGLGSNTLGRFERRWARDMSHVCPAVVRSTVIQYL
jgi:hypothetical protein